MPLWDCLGPGSLIWGMSAKMRRHEEDRWPRVESKEQLMKRYILFLVVPMGLLVSAACSGGSTPEPTPALTATPSATATAEPTLTATAVPSATPPRTPPTFSPRKWTLIGALTDRALARACQRCCKCSAASTSRSAAPRSHARTAPAPLSFAPQPRWGLKLCPPTKRARLASCPGASRPGAFRV